MRTFTITRRQILLSVILWFTVFFALETTDFNYFEILNIVGFISLAILPGLLTLIAAEIKGLPFWGYLSLTIGFSLLELMIMGLAGNTLLPLFGIARPLDKPFLLFDFYILIGALAATVWVRIKDIEITVKRYIFLENPRDALISFLPIIFPILAIFGAIQLNDGGTGILTMVMLGAMGFYILVLVCYWRECDDNTLPTAIFFMALSLLLMTSLRGWYVTGHDIQRETKVFELARNAGIWNIAAYRDAYNACLSITILPTVFTNLMSVADQYVFKLFYQIFFALCPVLVYLIGTNWTSRRIAFLGSLYFVAFPTFFTDMPFIDRQEIAFIFFGLMLYLILQETLKLNTRRILFVVMGIGVILSHYSTTYIILIIFGLAALSRPIFLKVIKYLQNKSYLSHSALSISDRSVKGPKITLPMVGLLLVLSFIWTSIITKTGNGVAVVIDQTFSAVSEGFGGANRSIDATSLLSFSKPDLNSELQAYISNVVNPIRETGYTGEYFPEATYSKYPIVALNYEVLPISKLGTFLDEHHIDVTTAMSYVGQLLAKLAELFIPVGTLYLFFRNRVADYIDDELYLIALYSLIFIGLNIILPVLSVQYGIFRAIQQSMFIIAPFLVIGSIAIGRFILTMLGRLLNLLRAKFTPALRLHLANLDMTFAVTFAIAFFLYSTGFIPQIFGNNPALLHLNNAGEYYNDFLTQTQEVYSIDWLAKIPQGDPSLSNQIQFEVESDRFSSTKLASVASLASANDILPAIVRTNAYVFLSVANVLKQRASEVYDGDRISYTYPLQFLNANKNLVYNNGGSRIYK